MSELGCCLFCLNFVQSADNTFDTTKTFIIYLQSFVKVDILDDLLEDLKSSKIPPVLLPDCCEKCQQSVHEFCEVYHKIKLLEIELELKLDKLVNTIQKTDDKSSKWENSSNLLENIFNNDVDARNKCTMMIKQFRENIKKGRQKLAESHQRAFEKQNEKPCTTMQSTIVPTTLPEVDVGTDQLAQGILRGSTKISDRVDDQAKCDESKNNEGNSTKPDENFANQVDLPTSLIQPTLVLEDFTENKVQNFPSSSQLISAEDVPRNIDGNAAKCVQCGRLFNSKRALERHTFYVHADRSLPCPHCEKKYHTQVQLTMHIEAHKNPGEWKWQCKMCEKKFVRQSKLNKHTKTHVKTQSKPFEKTLNDEPLGKGSQEQQIISQAPTSPVISRKKRKTDDMDLYCIKCEECPKRFKSKIDLDMHMASRQFACEVCGKKYHHNNWLIKHMKRCQTRNDELLESGTQEQQIISQPRASPIIRRKKQKTGDMDLYGIKCVECGRTFKSKTDLDMHLGSRQFSCAFCGEKYYHITSLHMHTQRCQKSESWICPECDKCFKFEDELIHHITTHTTDKPSDGSTVPGNV